MRLHKRITAILVLLGTLFAASLAIRFRHYDNGAWVRTPVLGVYLRELRGFGRSADPARRLPPNWGLFSGYTARNFTLDLLNLDYSQPLKWEDVAAGPGIVVCRLGPQNERLPVAIYPNSRVEGLSTEVILSKVPSDDPGAIEGNEPIVPRYRLTLRRLPFTSTLYVTSVVNVPETER
ncbi:MAG: hypothetical protein ACM3X4_00500 [Ignavibacteriales bacterium]